MPLLSLPTEIFHMILRFVGAKEFQAQLSRLHVCKAWYAVAQDVLLEEPRLSQKSLERLLLVPRRMRALLEVNLQRLSICLDPCKDLAALGSPQSPWPPRPERAYWALNRWISQANDDLVKFGELLPYFAALKQLELKAPTELRSMPPFDTSDSYIHGSSLSVLLFKTSTLALTTLVLDTWGTSIVWPFNRHAHVHICPLLARQLVNLRRLRLRMRRICPEVLGMDDDRFPHLATVAINLCLPGSHGPDMSSVHSSYCMTYSPRDAWGQKDLVDAAISATQRMPKLKVMRILFFTSFFDIIALDCISGKRMSLPAGADWDDDGEVLAELFQGRLPS